MRDWMTRLYHQVTRTKEFRDLWIESPVFICYPFPLVLTCVHEPIELNPALTLATRDALVVLLYTHFDAYYVGI